MRQFISHAKPNIMCIFGVNFRAYTSDLVVTCPSYENTLAADWTMDWKSYFQSYVRWQCTTVEWSSDVRKL